MARLAPLPWPLRLLREFTHLFLATLWVAAAPGFFAASKAPDQGMVRVGAAIVDVILISGLFVFWQEWRAERTLVALQRLLPPRVRALRDGALTELPAEALVPDDLIPFEAGDGVPADCRLVEGFGLRITTATATAESAALPRGSGPSSDALPQQAENVLLAGTAVVAGQGTALNFATDTATEFGRIACLTAESGEAVSPMRQELALLLVAVGARLFAICLIACVPVWEDLLFALGIIVAMVPEGLLPTLTVALVLAARRMAGRQVLVRQLTAVEALGAATVICTDKTATLTENRVRVRAASRRRDLRRGAGDPARARFGARPLLPCGDDLPRPAGWRARRAPDGRSHGRRTARTRRHVGCRWRGGGLAELPFESERMCHSVLHPAPDGPLQCCKGAPERVLPLCTILTNRDGAVRPMLAVDRAAILAAEEAMATRGLRVIAFACHEAAAGCVAPGPRGARGTESHAERDAGVR